VFKKIVYTVGILTIIFIFGKVFQLRNPDQPGLIDPSNPVKLPHVSVSK
jgi:hypothetical protein